MVRIYRVKPLANADPIRFDDVTTESITMKQLSGIVTEPSVKDRVVPRYLFKNDESMI